jgi:predicted transcriptional regulator
MPGKLARAKRHSNLVAPQPIADLSRLAPSEVILALRLREDGLTQTQIAHRLNCSQSTISDLLAAYLDTRVLATAHLRGAALQLAKRVTRDPDVDQALEVLTRIDVVTKASSGGSAAAAVVVVVGMPGQPAGLAPQAYVDVVSATPPPPPSLPVADPGEGPTG